MSENNGNNSTFQNSSPEESKESKLNEQTVESENTAGSQSADSSATSGGQKEASSSESTEKSLDSVAEELAKAKSEIDNLKDSWMRERAEFQNYKRRTAQEFKNFQAEAIKNLIVKFFEPIDNLARVSENVNVTDDLKPFVQGVEMIRKEFQGILEKENVFRIDPKGEAFDPMMMEAIASEESTDYTEDTVVEVYQSGYYLKEGENKVMLRPSRVRVAKAVQRSEGNGAEDVGEKGE